MIHVKNRELVVPGQLVAEGDYWPQDGTFREGKKIYSAVVGLASLHGEDVKVIPLQGRYMPTCGDLVVGVAIDSHRSGWILDLNSPYVGNLFVSDLLHRKVDLNNEDISGYMKTGDVVVAGVRDVSEQMRVQLETEGPGMGKVKDGEIVEISPMKVPRVLGRKGSMLKILQELGECRIVIGQNGRIIIWGKNQHMMNAVIDSILMIEREAHTSGLTDRVRLKLEKEKSGGK